MRTETIQLLFIMFKKTILAAAVAATASGCAVTGSFDYQSVETRKVEKPSPLR